MFEGLTEEMLTSKGFKEDSVRELIILPILKRLGFSLTGQYKIARSRSLKYPFIQIGTRKFPVTIVPDYILLDGEKPILVLDAKRPSENLSNREHIQQVYSYAIHPEIKVDHFALCNGREIVMYDRSGNDPIFREIFSGYESNWNNLEKFFGPKFLVEPYLRGFVPDFGAALYRLGLRKAAKITMLGVQLNVFGKLNDRMLSASSNCEFSGEMHCVTFDFHKSKLRKILSCLPEPLREQFDHALGHAPFRAAAELAIELDIEVIIGSCINLKTEQFYPLEIKSVIASRFIPSRPFENNSEFPEEIYRLRDHYKISEAIV